MNFTRKILPNVGSSALYSASLSGTNQCITLSLGMTFRTRVGTIWNVVGTKKIKFVSQKNKVCFPFNKPILKVGRDTLKYVYK